MTRRQLAQASLEMRADARDVRQQAAVQQLIDEVRAPARQASRLPPYVLP